MNPEWILTADDDITHAIRCRKIFKSAPSKTVEKNRNSDRRFDVYSQEDGSCFSVFITQSLRKPEEFSCGLILGGHYLLFRVNGFHGPTRAGKYPAEHHAYPHTHILTMVDINNGRALHPSSIQDTTGKYFDIRTAQLFFFEECGIIGFEDHFPELLQVMLF